MPSDLRQQLNDLQVDIDALTNGARLSSKELENRANRLLDAVAQSAERRALAPQLQGVVSSLDRLLRTLEDKANRSL